MTFKEIVEEIRETKELHDLIRSLPAWHASMQDKIFILLNKKLESRLIELHKLLMETEIK